MTNSPRRIRVLAATYFALFATLTVPAAAQRSPVTKAQQSPGAAAETAPRSVVGTWVGTATVPLADSAIVVPVLYTFADGTDGVTGTAMVPGQGTGPISNVVRDGVSIRFRVTVKQGLLEHDATMGANVAIEGMVNLNKLPVAKFRITLRK